MADPVGVLGGAVAAGPVTVRDLGLRGMITLRGDHGDGALRDVATRLSGTAFPAANRAEVAGERGIAWMSPDEILLMVPYGDVAGALEQIAAALAGVHHLAVDVSDARAVIGVEGPGAREVLGKLAPVDLHPGAFSAGMFRRTRLGQIAAAFWADEEDRFVVVCFRSVGDYAFQLIAQSAKDGAVGYY